jgi:hypothetical protein
MASSWWQTALRKTMGPVVFSGDPEIILAIKTENYDEVIRVIKNPSVLEQKSSNGLTPIFYAIQSGNLDIVNAIIEKDPSVLKQKDSNATTPIFYAIQSGNLNIVNAIIEKDPSVLKQKNSSGDTPIFQAISSEKLDIVQAIIEKDPSVLKQKDSNGMTPIFQAISSGELDIVQAIIKKDRSVLEQKDSYGDTPIFYATLECIRSSVLDKEKEGVASKVLNVTLEQQFQRPIDNASQEDFIELVLKKKLLKGIYSEERASFNFKWLEKAFDKITPENTSKNTFEEIYQELFKKVNKNQPITSKKNEEMSIFSFNLQNLFIKDVDKNQLLDPRRKEEVKNEEMYVFQSELKRHESFFIFHVNKQDGKLTSISYCDGNEIDTKRKITNSIINSPSHINGVTTFKLKAPIGYDNEFAQNFIDKNTKNKSKEDFYKQFKEKKIEIQGAEIDYEKTSHSIPTKKQRRGNCAFKSTSLLARFILETTDPTMKFGFDMNSQKPTGVGYDKYKEFKDGLTKKTLKSIIETKETISSKSDSFSEYLKKYIKDIVEMVEVHSKRKLSKYEGPRTEFYQEINDKYGSLVTKIRKNEALIPDQKESRHGSQSQRGDQSQDLGGEGDSNSRRASQDSNQSERENSIESQVDQQDLKSPSCFPFFARRVSSDKTPKPPSPSCIPVSVSKLFSWVSKTR